MPLTRASLSFMPPVSTVEGVCRDLCTEGSRQLLIRSRASLSLRPLVHVTACQFIPFL